MTGMRPVKTVGELAFGPGAVAELEAILAGRRSAEAPSAVYFVDHYFEGSALLDRLGRGNRDPLYFVDSTHEPTTADIDGWIARLGEELDGTPAAVIGVGGGCALDTAKAVSNLLGNGGQAQDYQGWDLLSRPGVFKVGVPTLSGTGAEASRTCVMTNPETKLKLGMNSDYTVFDQLVLDPELSATVPRDQYFYTGMDTYIHCIESLGGSYRHGFADAFAREALDMARQVFLAPDMMTADNREKLMIASYLGGSAIGNSFVGVVHPLSAGLSVVLGVHHCIGNCLVINVLDDFYPAEAEEFRRMMAAQGVSLPAGICRDLPDAQFDALYEASIMHEKPLANALGPDFRDILTRDKAGEIFARI